MVRMLMGGRIQGPGLSEKGDKPLVGTGGNKGHSKGGRLELVDGGVMLVNDFTFGQPSCPCCDQYLVSLPVPPSKPTISVPSSATIGNQAVLTCSEKDGSPPSEYFWFKDGVLMPTEPKSNRAFINSSYSLNPKTGELVWMGMG